MGWTSFPLYDNKSNREIMRKEVESDNENGTWKVLEDMATGNSYFAIMSKLDKKTNMTSRFVIVCMIRRTRREFSYKDMAETSEPYVNNVNRKFLDKVYIMVNINAHYGHLPEQCRLQAFNWRTACENYINTRKENRAKIAKELPAGTKILYGKTEYMLLQYEKVRFKGNRKAHFAYRTNTGAWIKESQVKKATIL